MSIWRWACVCVLLVGLSIQCPGMAKSLATPLIEWTRVLYSFTMISESLHWNDLQMKPRILSTQLYGNHTVQVINSFAVPLLRYSARLIHWTKQELYQLDVGTRKLMCLHHVFSMNSDIDRLYVPRSQGGRGLCSVADVIEDECRSLGLYLEQSSEPLLQAVHAKKWFSSESTSEFKACMISLHYENCSQKALHGLFCRETATYVDNKWQRAWLQSSRLSPVIYLQPSNKQLQQT